MHTPTHSDVPPLTHCETDTQRHRHTDVAVLFQELECAVSMEEDNRQEWTFTLYDFDNNGKVTREVNCLFPEGVGLDGLRLWRRKSLIDE